uniref:Jerky protein homolog-like n=1 Tax=Saccoglossus kowalevskii TaxID=10224 RepID=A0ABM0MPP4_SACKO|nr:PREDICTED: jerky protein homolog-like [Saccoglossus kowalevskii]
MTDDLFSSWFLNEFVPAMRSHLARMGLPQRVILLVDNAGSHSLKGSQLESPDGNIKCSFLPPNTTSKLQPLDQGIIAIMNKYYRRNMLRAVVDEDNEDKNLKKIVKTFTVKDALFMIADSWNRIKPSTVAGCWYNGLHVGDHGNEQGVSTNESEEITAEINKARVDLGLGVIAENELDAWINCDNDIGSETFTEDEIVKIVAENQKDDIESDNNEKENITCRPTHKHQQSQ